MDFPLIAFSFRTSSSILFSGSSLSWHFGYGTLITERSSVVKMSAVVGYEPSIHGIGLARSIDLDAVSIGPNLPRHDSSPFPL